MFFHGPCLINCLFYVPFSNQKYEVLKERVSSIFGLFFCSYSKFSYVLDLVLLFGVDSFLSFLLFTHYNLQHIYSFKYILNTRFVLFTFSQRNQVRLFSVVVKVLQTTKPQFRSPQGTTLFSVFTLTGLMASLTHDTEMFLPL